MLSGMAARARQRTLIVTFSMWALRMASGVAAPRLLGKCIAHRRFFAVNSMQPAAAVKVLSQTVEIVGEPSIKEDDAQVRGIDGAEYAGSLNEGGDVAVGLGGIQGAIGASGGQWETGGASTDASRVQVLSVTGRSGIFTISRPALSCARPRCLFRCRSVAATALGPAISPPVLAQPFGASRLRQVSKPPHEPELKTPA